jgi:uncharacterized membrane protein
MWLLFFHRENRKLRVRSVELIVVLCDIFLFKEFFFSNSTKHNWVRLSTHNVKATQLIAEIIIALYITKPYN